MANLVAAVAEKLKRRGVSMATRGAATTAPIYRKSVTYLEVEAAASVAFCQCLGLGE
jgi:hypothetical protein